MHRTLLRARRQTKIPLGAPGQRRPAIVALSKPKASAPRLHKAIPATNTRSAEAGPRPLAWQGGAAESTNTKPSDGNARASCRSAACFGASPVASALGLESRRDPALDSHHSTTASAATRPQPDISTWQRIGHFYLALTIGANGWYSLQPSCILVAALERGLSYV